MLGLKGQISELELHTIRARLHAGVLNKARRGELCVVLPTGLVRLETGEVVKHPHQEVQSRLALIFETMLEAGAISRVVRMLRDHQLLVPRRDHYGEIQLFEQIPLQIVAGRRRCTPRHRGTSGCGRIENEILGHGNSPRVSTHRGGSC